MGLALVGTVLLALFVLKWPAAASAVATAGEHGALPTRALPLSLEHRSAAIRPLARTANYLSAVWPALAIGILLGGAVRAFVSPASLARLLGAAGAPRAQLAAGLAGAPLMLCSCCVAPIFTSVFEKTRRLGPSLGIMTAAPALNVAALVLTFLLFDTSIAVGRLAMSACMVFVATALVGRLDPCAAAPADPGNGADTAEPSLVEALRIWAKETWRILVRTLPFVLAGVLASSILADFVPRSTLAGGGGVLTIAAVSFVAVLLALPTFFEIPLALALLGAGAPAGAVAAVLFAGPVVNLPSLLTVARSTSWRVGLALGAAAWVIALLGGLIVGQ